MISQFANNQSRHKHEMTQKESEVTQPNALPFSLCCLVVQIAWRWQSEDWIAWLYDERDG